MLRFSLVAVLVFVAAMSIFAEAAFARTFVNGGTIVDTTAFGRSRGDLTGQVLIIDGERIVKIGPPSLLREATTDDQVIDAEGLFIVPGLIEGFGAMKRSGFAAAYLRAGVTTVVTPMEGRRGAVSKPTRGPMPDLLQVASIGREPLSTPALLRQIDQIDRSAYDILHLMGAITNDQLGPVVELAKRRGFVVIGELVAADPSYGAQLGIDVLVHSQRYAVELASASLRAELVGAPFDDALDGSKWRYYDALAETPMEAMGVWARKLASSSTAFMPTAGLTSVTRQHRAEPTFNPWLDPLAVSVLPELVHCPPDRDSGAIPFGQARRQAHEQLADTVDKLEANLRGAGVRYLAGSGTNVYGTLPGVT